MGLNQWSGANKLPEAVRLARILAKDHIRNRTLVVQAFDEGFCIEQVERIQKFLASIMQDHNIRRNDRMDHWAIRQLTDIERRA